MSALRYVLLGVIVAIMASFLITGCAVHAEASMGAGSGTKYAASMKGGRGVGIDFPADAKDISRKVETKIGRVARDD